MYFLQAKPAKSPKARTHMIVAWSIVVIFLVSDIIMFPFGRLTFAPGTFQLILRGVLIICAAYIAAFAVAKRCRSDHSTVGHFVYIMASRAKVLIHAAAFMFASGVTGVVFTYLATGLDLSLQDAALAGIDKALNFDWPRFLTLLNQRPLLSSCLVFSYHATGYYLLLVILFTGLSEKAEPLSKFLTVMALCDLMTGVVAACVPAAGAYAYYQPAKALFTNFTGIGGLDHLGVLTSLRSNAITVLDLKDTAGLISFPSFHTELAIMFAWAVRNVRYLAIPAMLFSAVTIVSALPEGGHHLVDLIAGACITGIAIWIVQTYSRGKTFAQYQPASA